LGATLTMVPLFWDICFPCFNDLEHQFAYQFKFPPVATHCVSAISVGATLFFVCTQLQTIKQLYQEWWVLIFWRKIPASLFGLFMLLCNFRCLNI